MLVAPRFRALAVLAVTIGFLLAPAAHAALRSPQIAVSGTALQSFFTSQGQAINVNTDQQDAQVFSLPALSTFSAQEFGTAALFGGYNANQAVPTLDGFMPGTVSPGWFVVASFRDSPIRLIVNVFDQNSVPQGTNTYLGADRTNFAFFDQGTSGTFYAQDARNPGGAARILVFSGTGARAGSTWFACETGPGPGGDFADTITLLGLATAPVPTAHSSWSRVKAIYH